MQKVQDWRWSSLWIRENGTSAQNELLSDWPVEKPSAYLEWVNTLDRSEEENLEKIRYSIKRGRPFGKDDWIKKIAESFGLISTLTQRRRPKKGA